MNQQDRQSTPNRFKKLYNKYAPQLRARGVKLPSDKLKQVRQMFAKKDLIAKQHKENEQSIMTSINIYTAFAFIVFVLSSASYAEARKLHKAESPTNSCDDVKQHITKLKKQSLATMIISIIVFVMLSMRSMRVFITKTLSVHIMPWLNIVMLGVVGGLSANLASLWTTVKNDIDKKPSCITTSLKADKFKSISITSSVFAWFLFVFLLFNKFNVNIIQMVIDKMKDTGYEAVSGGVTTRDVELANMPINEVTNVMASSAYD